MKNLIWILILISSSISFASPLELTLEDVAKKVSNDNFLVLENAERVYQKKENIKFARANLLPKLNIWNLLKLPSIFVDPLSVGDIIQDFAPFLVPANWFKVAQSKHLYKARKEQYRALWANEVNTAKLLFVSVYRDQVFANLILQKQEKYKEIMQIAKTRNIFGNGNSFAYNLVRDRYLSLVEDSRNLENLVFSEIKELQFLTGINNEEEIVIKAPLLPKLEGASKIDFSKIIFKAIEASPEVFQYEHLINALSKVRGQINFSILGTSTFSMGEGNGVFDHIPIQDGLGFGMGASIRISKSEGRILKTQLKGTIETIKRQVNVLVKEYNSLIHNYKITKERIELANSNYEAMMNHIAIGGTLNVMEMVEILDNLYASKILLLSYHFRFSDLVEKLKRITFSGDYSSGPKLNIVE
jgi:outer membrane protein TolC